MIINDKGLSKGKGSTQLVSTHRAVRTSRNLVELTIGIIGVIGIMLANLGQQQNVSLMLLSHQQNVQTNENNWHAENSVTRKVRSLTKVSPSANQINLMNILF